MNLNSKIGLGTVQFGVPYGISNKSGQTPASAVKEIFTSLPQYNIKVIDTASGYGKAEDIIGENDLSAFNVSTVFLQVSENTVGYHQLSFYIRKP